jgi:hypothetical protein
MLWWTQGNAVRFHVRLPSGRPARRLVVGQLSCLAGGDGLTIAATAGAFGKVLADAFDNRPAHPWPATVHWNSRRPPPNRIHRYDNDSKFDSKCRDATPIAQNSEGHRADDSDQRDQRANDSGLRRLTQIRCDRTDGLPSKDWLEPELLGPRNGPRESSKCSNLRL